MDEGLVRNFPPTRHSALTALRSSDSVERARGLETLCSVYWRPVYGYLRLHWRFPHDQAADLTQEFFAVLLEKELLQRFDPSRARLRTWLRACVDGVVSSVDRAAARQKRGGDARHLDWEEARGERRCGSAAARPSTSRRSRPGGQRSRRSSQVPSAGARTEDQSVGRPKASQAKDAARSRRWSSAAISCRPSGIPAGPRSSGSEQEG